MRNMGLFQLQNADWYLLPT